MSFRALTIGASGLSAQGQRLNVISNNVANSQTDGFRRMRADFATLLGNASQATGPVGTGAGGGVTVGATVTDFRQGPLRQTGRDLDAAIAGPGFFEVADDQGNRFLTRAGNFTQSADGELVLPTNGGLRVQPPIAVPANATQVSIAGDGTVSGVVDGQAQQLGQLQAVRVQNPDGLAQLPGNLFTETAASGNAERGGFGADGFGSVQQGFLEGSNVEAVTELTDLLQAQSAFQFDAEIIRSVNERLQLLTQLRGS